MVAGKPNAVVALDFDGVLVDSARESSTQAIKAFNEMGGRVRANEAVFQKLHNARPLIVQISDYLTAVRLVAEKPEINFSRMTREAFAKEAEKDKRQGPLFDKKFKGHRDEMATRHPEEWAALNRVYPEALEIVRAAKRKGNAIVVATVKDKDAVKRLLARYKIPIPAGNIYGKEITKDKMQQLRMIAKRFGLPMKRITLVDDAPEWVAKAKKAGANAMLAQWGYVTKRETKGPRKVKPYLGRKGAGKKLKRFVGRTVRRK